MRDGKAAWTTHQCMTRENLIAEYIGLVVNFRSPSPDISFSPFPIARYDGDLFDDESALMQLYDVGMSSMFVQEAYSLAELAAVIGRKPELVNMLRARGDAMRDKIASHLWDDESQIFVNRFPNGTFYRHVSPTSFYPLFTGAATAEQADIMVQSWLLNSSRFCISPEGDFAGNDPDRSYWGLPSISADDPQFMASNNN